MTAVLQHPSTTAEVRALCRDLQVLGRSEFKHLLRWRLELRKALASELGEAAMAAGAAAEDKVKGKSKNAAKV